MNGKKDSDILIRQRCPICWETAGGHAVDRRPYAAKDGKLYYRCRLCGNGWNWPRTRIFDDKLDEELARLFKSSIPGRLETVEIGMKQAQDKFAELSGLATKTMLRADKHESAMTKMQADLVAMRTALDRLADLIEKAKSRK